MMNKFKMLSLSLVAAFSFGVSATFSSVQAAESLTPEVSVAADTIWVTKTVLYTYTQALWVTETRNGITYSGYIYNRGMDSTGNYSIFTGYLKSGPYAELSILENE